MTRSGKGTRLVVAMLPVIGLLAAVGGNAPMAGAQEQQRVLAAGAKADLDDAATARRVSANPVISARGRYVAFDSSARLVRGDTNGVRDVYVRDTLTGRIQRVSVSNVGHQAVRGSFDPAISATGRYVAFTSRARLVSAAEDDNHVMDVYVRDRSAGTTNLVSTGIGWPPGDLQSRPASDPHRSRVERQSGDGPSYEAVISADGNFVAFTSEASNLGPGIGDMNSLPDVYVRNRSTWKIRRVSVTSAEAERAWYANADAISAHGRFVAFTWDDNFRLHLMVRDRSAGTTRQIARNSSLAAMSAHGRFVTFTKPISVGVGWDPDGSETGKPYKVLRWSRSTGQTQRVSVSDSEQPGNSGSFGAALTVRGGHVAFTSIATNLVVGDTNHRADVFVRDRAAGRTARISVNSRGGQGNGASREPAVSATGRYVAFTSHASNLVARDPNGHGSDVFVRDRKTGRTHLVSARGNFRPST